MYTASTPYVRGMAFHAGHLTLTLATLTLRRFQPRLAAFVVFVASWEALAVPAHALQASAVGQLQPRLAAFVVFVASWEALAVPAHALQASAIVQLQPRLAAFVVFVASWEARAVPAPRRATPTVFRALGNLSEHQRLYSTPYLRKAHSRRAKKL